MHRSAYLAGNLQEQGLQTEQHVKHCSCLHFSQHQFPLISVVEPKKNQQVSLELQSRMRIKIYTKIKYLKQ